ncbi:hypothetical protein C8R45DRAFT_1114030 [Mycena sanguinolenta]|nr:hypothetical protein C8R45DRAFT_1114030 [Mycena sanguinolenta]
MSSESSVATAVAHGQAVDIDALRPTLQRVFATPRFLAVNPVAERTAETPNALVFAPNSLLVATAQQHIISHCAACSGPHVVPHPSLPGARLFVERRNPSLVEEARTQAYLYQHARSSSSCTAPNMAEVYGTFYEDHGSTYLVMEHIDAVPFRAGMEGSADEQRRARRSATAAAAITEAVAWLLTCPLPDAGRIGPVGGGCMFHCFYGMGQAPVSFVDAVTLEEYVNEVRTAPPTEAPRRPHLARRRFTHSDPTLDTYNLLCDPSTPRRRIWLIDCQHINVLPSAFFSFYLHRSCCTDPLVRARDVPVSAKLPAAAIVMQSGNSSFGIDENGHCTWSSGVSGSADTSAALSKT